MISIVGLAAARIIKNNLDSKPSSVVIPDNIITEEADEEKTEDKTEQEETTDETEQDNVAQTVVSNAAGKDAVVIKLFDRSAPDNQPFNVGNMFPGDTKTHYYGVQVSYGNSVTVHFSTHIRPSYEKLAEVLGCQVVEINTGRVVYDGLLKNMPESITHQLKANGKTTYVLYYATEGKQNNVGKYLYRVGNENTVSLDTLFEAKDGATIGTVSVTFEALNGTAASGTYTSNDTWTNGTIQFSGTGVVKVTITDDDYCIPTVLYLEVIDATNLTSATGTTTGGNFVLLCDVNTFTFKLKVENGTTVTIGSRWGASGVASPLPSGQTIGTATADADKLIEEEIATPQYTMHTIAEGDTLESIAQQYGLTVEQICEYNDIAADTVLVVGEQIAIPIVATGEETTGDESTGDETTGDETTGDESTGDESTGDESTGNELQQQSEGEETGADVPDTQSEDADAQDDTAAEQPTEGETVTE